MQPYKTIMKRGFDEFIVQKSRFIGYGAPAENEEGALAFLAEIRTRHKDASHNCYAYIIGANGGIMRYSDDGEPGGTAGLPIIETLKSAAVTNLCVVVTRYFGGILLGAGGLARAYAQGAASALRACEVGVMHPTGQYLMEVPYPLFGKLEHYLHSAPVRVEEKRFLDSVTLTLAIRMADAEGVEREIAELFNGQLELLLAEEGYMAWREG